MVPVRQPIEQDMCQVTKVEGSASHVELPLAECERLLAEHKAVG